MLVPPHTDSPTTATANGHTCFCCIKSSALASARDYWLVETAFKFNEMGVVLKTEEVNEHRNFADSHFT